MHGWGCVWLGIFLFAWLGSRKPGWGGGMYGWGTCMAWGHVWLGGVCMAGEGSMHGWGGGHAWLGRGHAWLGGVHGWGGMCVWGHACPPPTRYTVIIHIDSYDYHHFCFHGGLTSYIVINLNKGVCCGEIIFFFFFDLENNSYTSFLNLNWKTIHTQFLKFKLSFIIHLFN